MHRRDETLYKETIHRFLQLHRNLRRYGRQVHVKGISGRKISALRYLLEAGPLSIGKLCDYHHLSVSSTSEMIAQLEKAGFVTRTRSEEDNRVVLVDLTPAGRAFTQDTPLGGIPLLREKLKTLPPERLSIIHEALTDLVQFLEIARE
jgi:DNA-binding MarR family transcriptional regulator